MAHLFEPERLHELARRHTGAAGPTAFEALIGDLSTAYPGRIETRLNWLFSLTAGATGIMTVLYGSLSEYLLLFGTPVGTEGFSGRYRMDIYDVVLSGEMWTYTEDRPYERVVARPGDIALLPRRRVKGFRLREETWLLEYGRGLVPTALPLALGDAVFSAMDCRTVFKTFWVYGGLVFRELLRGKI
jgi:C-8 sterol isomerase